MSNVKANKPVDKLALLRALWRRLGRNPDEIIPKKLDQQIDGCLERLQEKLKQEGNSRYR